MANTSPNRVSRFSEKPSTSMPAKVPVIEIRIAVVAIAEARTLCRKTYMTTTTSSSASNSVFTTSLIDRRTKSVVSSAIV